jgi:hypothetical protein
MRTGTSPLPRAIALLLRCAQTQCTCAGATEIPGSPILFMNSSSMVEAPHI